MNRWMKTVGARGVWVSVFWLGACGEKAPVHPRYEVVSAVEFRLLREELDDMLHRYVTERFGVQVSELPPGRKKQLERELVDRWVRHKLALREAESGGYLPSMQEVEAELERRRERFLATGRPGLFEQWRVNLGLSEAELPSYLRAEMALERAVDRRMPQSGAISESELRRAYQEDLQRWTLPAEAEVDRIRLTVPVGSSAGERARMRALLEEAREEVVRGADFAQLAEKLSDDFRQDGKWNGARDNRIVMGAQADGFTRRVFEFGPVDLTPVFEEGNAFYLVKVHRMTEAVVLPFENVRENVYDWLIAQRREREREALLDQWKRAAGVKIR